MTEYKEVGCSGCGHTFEIPKYCDSCICPNCKVLLIDYVEGKDALMP